jgi:hypothetical protein
VAPVLPNGYTLLGETDKYVSVSPDRFKSVVASGGAGANAGISVTLVGAPSEQVKLAYIGPTNVVNVRTVAVAANGKWAGFLAD